MMADVPTADVVIVNPTHFAVALRYDGRRPAPEVVAKGADHVAARDPRASPRSTACRSSPTRRSRARSTARSSSAQLIPEALFAAVAEVLAFVYRTARRRRGGRAAGATPKDPGD